MAIPDNLAAYWKLDESSGNPADATGLGNTLTNNGTVTFSAGKLYNGANVSPTGTKYLSAPDNFDFTSGSAQIWIKPTSFTSDTQRRGVLSTRNGPVSKGFELRFNRGNLNNKLDFFFGDNLYTCQSTTSLIAGTWYHVVATWSTLNKKIYINGTLETTDTNAETLSAGSTFKIGRNFDGEITDSLIDEVGIWSRQITDSEVKTLYNSGNSFPFPLSGYWETSLI